MDNDQIIRRAYQIAEDKDSEGWLAVFTPDGTFTDESVGVNRAFPVENYGRAYSDMHRELYRIFVNGDIVVVQLALQGTHDGRSAWPTTSSNRPATGWTRPAATCSSWRTARSSASTATRRGP